MHQRTLLMVSMNGMVQTAATSTVVPVEPIRYGIQGYLITLSAFLKNFISLLCLQRRRGWFHSMDLILYESFGFNVHEFFFVCIHPNVK